MPSSLQFSVFLLVFSLPVVGSPRRGERGGEEGGKRGGRERGGKRGGEERATAMRSLVVWEALELPVAARRPVRKPLKQSG